MAKILVADDDPSLREVLRYTLCRAGHEVVEAADGGQALDRVVASAPDLIVLDVSMPEMDGLEVCRRVRAFSNVPILFLSSRGEEVDKILGLEMGGDDYLTKPFSPRELQSRIKAILRRVSTVVEPQSSAAGIRVDSESLRVFANNTELSLTATEFRLLSTLVSRPEKVFTRQELIDHTYGMGHAVSDRTIDSHVRRIRKKLKEVGVSAIETVHGMGFRLNNT